MVQLSHPYTTTGKTIVLTTGTFVSKDISLLFNILSKFVITLLPRSKYLFFFFAFSFMTAVTICSDFGAQENKVCHYFHFSPIYLPWSAGTGYHDPSSLNVDFRDSFFTLIKRLFSFSSLSAISIVSSANLNMSANLESSAVATGLKKVSFHSNPKGKQC